MLFRSERVERGERDKKEGVFAKLLESGLSQGDALTILEKYAEEEKKNNKLRLPGV
jgi:hypothetical protein